jgi:hypothetical protein
MNGCHLSRTSFSSSLPTTKSYPVREKLSPFHSARAHKTPSPQHHERIEERNSNILGKVMKPVELPERAEECQNITASSNLLGLVINHRVFYHKKWITLIISILFFKNNRTNLNPPQKKKKTLAKNTNISFTKKSMIPP